MLTKVDKDVGIPNSKRKNRAEKKKNKIQENLMCYNSGVVFCLQYLRSTNHSAEKISNGAKQFKF